VPFTCEPDRDVTWVRIARLAVCGATQSRRGGGRRGRRSNRSVRLEFAPSFGGTARGNWRAGCSTARPSRAQFAGQRGGYFG